MVRSVSIQLCAAAPCGHFHPTCGNTSHLVPVAGILDTRPREPDRPANPFKEYPPHNILPATTGRALVRLEIERNFLSLVIITATVKVKPFIDREPHTTVIHYSMLVFK